MNDIETVREFIECEDGPYVGERKAALAAFERVIAGQAQAVKDEREACAKIFDEWPTFDVWRSQAAASIRARQNGGEG